MVCRGIPSLKTLSVVIYPWSRVQSALPLRPSSSSSSSEPASPSSGHRLNAILNFYFLAFVGRTSSVMLLRAGFNAPRAPPIQAVGCLRPSSPYIHCRPTSPHLLQVGAAGCRGRGTTASLQALEVLALPGTDALKAQANTRHMIDKTHYPLALDPTGLPQFDEFEGGEMKCCGACLGGDAWGSGIACRRRRLVASIMALLIGSVITEPLAGNAASSPARPRKDDEDYGIEDDEASSLVSLD